ncbi:MAG: U32 family peptidase, partial [Patescibacteria group bacterium]
QPCRWEYDVSRYQLKTGGHEEELELVEEKHGAYFLNSRDLCLIKHLKELAAAGVTSFKIEGRAKSVYYQAVVCGAYRRALNFLSKKISPAQLRKDLAYLYGELETKLVHRGYTSGFLLGQKADQNVSDSHDKSAWEFCGQVIKSEIGQNKKIKLHCQVHNTIRTGEILEIIRPEYDIIRMKPKVFWDAKTGQKLSEAHGGGGNRVIILELPGTTGAVPVLSVLRRKI